MEPWLIDVLACHLLAELAASDQLTAYLMWRLFELMGQLQEAYATNFAKASWSTITIENLCAISFEKPASFNS